ncbi:MAG: hypothetical protein FGM16_09180 [Flavobacterium sp.]|nr:hypothetical protein [Flavobacterium sp.]
MKKFLTQLLCFGLLFLAIDRSLIVLRNYVPQLEVDQRLEQVLQKKLKADVFVFGSSRGARDVIASQMGDSLQQKVYNLSYPGGDIEFQYFVLKQLLKTQKPKVILLVMDENTEIGASENVRYRLDRLYPLVKYPAVREELIRKGEKNKYLSELFILHQLNKSNFDLRHRKPSPLDTPLPCGSMPITTQMPNFTKKFDPAIPVYNPQTEFASKRYYFNQFLNACEKANTKVVLVFPPNFYAPSPAFYARMQQLANHRAYLMCYNSYDLRYQNPTYFNDKHHLRQSGAQLFTAEITGFIREQLVLLPPKYNP